MAASLIIDLDHKPSIEFSRYLMIKSNHTRHPVVDPRPFVRVGWSCLPELWSSLCGLVMRRILLGFWRRKKTISGTYAASQLFQYRRTRMIHRSGLIYCVRISCLRIRITHFGMTASSYDATAAISAVPIRTVCVSTAMNAGSSQR